MVDKTNRVAVFAHYDRDNLIQDYVVFYVQELKKVVDNIIFVSDSDVKLEELNKIKDYVTHSIVGKHGEYDFGSYKRGFLYAKANNLLENCEELVFCNDSCYGPIYPFENVFDAMSARECDYWGLTYNPVGITKTKRNPLYEDNTPHVQSFFVTFKPQVFNSDVFAEFINGVKQEKDKFLIIINYEIGLSKLLRQNGFKESVYCESSLNRECAFWFHYKKLNFHDKCPLIKTSVIRQMKKGNRRNNLLKMLSKYINYDIQLIQKDLKTNPYAKRLSLLQRIFSVYQDDGNFHTVFCFLGIKLALKNEDLHKIFSVVNSDDKKHKIVTIFGTKIKLRKRFLKDFNKIKHEKAMILNSKFWNSAWYKKEYHHNFSDKKALDYWYEKGWYKGESPSKYINVKHCGHLTHGVNPIIAYMDKNIVFLPDNKNNYKEENDAERIKEYLEYKPTRQARGVVYTCITNDYDDLREIEIYKYIDKNWDYVCFTDNQEHINLGQIGIWEIRPLFFKNLDNTRNSRKHKLSPHVLFPQYENSIWIDANINILSSHLFDEIVKKKQEIVVTEHFKNTCIYQEYQDVINAKLDDLNLINRELELIKKDNMPQNFGMPETNVLYRKHNSEVVKKLDENWLDMVLNYSKRDQLSFSYLLWKFGFDIANILIQNSRIDIDNFYVFDHKKGKF